MYNPLSYWEDIAFDIKSDDISLLINQKTNQNLEFEFKAYSLRESLGIEINPSGKLLPRVEEKIKSILTSKARLFKPASIASWLDDYEYLRKIKDRYLYQDKSGISEFPNLDISFKDKKVVLNLANKDSKVSMIFVYDKRPWSQNKFVLLSVSKRLETKGKHSLTVTNFDYFKAKRSLWLPKTVRIVTEQYRGKSKVREVKESYEFSNYRINQNIALNWFKTNN